MTDDTHHSPPQRRPIRSYVLRAGRMTEAQARAFEQGWDRWGVAYQNAPRDLDELFGRRAPRVLEIGFGMGQSLLAMAASSPDTDFIGIEVHTPGVGKLFHDMAETGVSNIRVYHHDAVEVIRDCIADDSLDGVQIFFPDPWHKKKHHKRRLVQPGFLRKLENKLRSGGVLHLATDWQSYAEQMMAVVSANEHFANNFGDGSYAPRPESRPQTRFERRGQRLGHGVWDLIFTRL